MKQMFGRKSGSGNFRLPILYDGWPLVAARSSPAALHIWELLSLLLPQVEPWLALPSDARWIGDEFRGNTLIDPVPHTPAGRLRWEQVVLPRLARLAGARLIHTTSLSIPLFSAIPCLASPAEPLSAGLPHGSFFSRLRSALNLGSKENVHAILWPNDLPDPPLDLSPLRLPPLVHSAFYQPQPPQSDFPGLFVFCPGPLAEDDLEFLFGVWGRASAGLGDDWTLLVSNLNPKAFTRLGELSRLTEDGAPVKVIDLLTPARWAAAIQQASIILATGTLLPWGDSLLQALACARPLAAQETVWSDARVGPAGYLTPLQDARMLAAAIITPLVEEPVAEQLSLAAVRQSAAWQSQKFPDKLWDIYQQIADY